MNPIEELAAVANRIVEQNTKKQEAIDIAVTELTSLVEDKTNELMFRYRLLLKFLDCKIFDVPITDTEYYIHVQVYPSSNGWHIQISNSWERSGVKRLGLKNHTGSPYVLYNGKAQNIDLKNSIERYKAYVNMDYGMLDKVVAAEVCKKLNIESERLDKILEKLK